MIIAVAAFEQPLQKMALPRVLLTPFLLGRPVGPVGDARTQQKVILAALELLESAQSATMAHFSMTDGPM